MTIAPTQPTQLFEELKSLIEKSRNTIATTVNAELSLLYWNIGKRIHKELMNEGRAEYGHQIVATVSRQLTEKYGKGFQEKSLRRMIQFAEQFPDEAIVVSAIRQLSWSHFVLLIPIKSDLKREYYAEMCRIERWSVRTLRKKIDSMLYERTALAKSPDNVVKHELDMLREKNKLTPDLVFRDPYVLEFLNLNDHYLEKDLEDAIMRELEKFLLELGGGFSFLARQKRITVDDQDYYLDLLFYHRDLNRLIAIDLKLGDFKPEHKGQMELYLRWLEKHEKRPSEQTPIGLILCAGKKQECIELLELGKAGIHIAEYITDLPPKKILQEKIHHAISQAANRF